MYRDKTTGQYPISKQELVSRNPHISLPAAWTDEVLDILGVDYVKPVAKPEITATQRLIEGPPEQREDGLWYQTWAITDMEAEEVAAMVAQEKDAKITAAAAACDAALAPLAARFSEYETKTWAKQLAEAQALLADPLMAAASYPTIAGIVAVTGEDAAEFAAAVVKNDEDWTAVSAYCVGMRQRIVAQVKAATTLDEVRAVDMTITLPG